ncbi:hypothetical protein NQ318_017633 [Aromia moschata]|uniref:Uncharacterized protein n=1 Tax=Aromia moschata TaxID=1265417 RepID=A0AAV8Z3K9_9CUCU|nr:hypothetical protein NQ318_017633 [Aromia moschata]
MGGNQGAWTQEGLRYTEGTRFKSVEVVQAKAMEVLNQLQKRTSSTAFNNGKFVWNGVEIAAKRSTLEAKKFGYLIATPRVKE